MSFVRAVEQTVHAQYPPPVGWAETLIVHLVRVDGSYVTLVPLRQLREPEVGRN